MAYWCSERWEVTIEGPAGRSVVSPNVPFARIGSHPDSDIVIPDSTVALRSHFFHATRDGVYCLFLDVAGSHPDEKGRWLAPDDEIVAGNYRLRARLLSAEQGDVLPDYDLSAWGSALPPLPVMLVYCGELLKDKRRFRARLSLVGRRPQCRLQLKGKQVSSFHCILYWDREQLWCVDLRSSNGTVLNGQEIDCAQIQIGDRLDVGEFGLVYQRRSQGGGHLRALSAQPAGRETNPGSRPPQVEPVPPAPAVQQELTGAELSGAELSGAVLSGAVLSGAVPAALAASPATSPDETSAESADDRRLREALAAEVARLGSQQELMQSRWNAANEQLSRQMAALRVEAAQLAREREALAGVRSQFLDEQNAQTQDLAERSAKLARIEEELASAAALLEANLLAGNQQRALLAESPDVTDLLAAEIARAPIVTGISHELPDELASAEAHLPPIIADATWESTLAGSASANPEMANSEAANPEPTAPFPPAPLQYLQSQWEETSERLRVQIEQLQAESAELTKERLALEQSRQDWQAERRALTDQLGVRAEQLARLEAELAGTAAELKQRLAEADARGNLNAACLCDEDAAALTQHEPIDSQWLGQFAPAAIVAGLDPDAASQIAAQIPPEVAWSYAPLDPADNLPPPPDAQAELQARWEAASQELAAQVEQLRAEASRLAADRQAFLASWDAWSAERDSAAEQLRHPQRTGVSPTANAPRALGGACEPAVDSDQVNAPDFALDWTAPARGRGTAIDKSADGVYQLAETPRATHPPPFVSARRYDMKTRDAEQLTMLVSSRVGEKYADQKRRLLWWSAGGIAALILLVTIVAGVMWVL